MSSSKVLPFVAVLLMLLGIACSANNMLSQQDADAVRSKLGVSPGAAVLFVQPG